MKYQGNRKGDWVGDARYTKGSTYWCLQIIRHISETDLILGIKRQLWKILEMSMTNTQSLRRQLEFTRFISRCLVSS